MDLLPWSLLTLKCIPYMSPPPTRQCQVPTRVDFHYLSTSQVKPGERKSSIYQTNNGFTIYFLGADSTYITSLLTHQQQTVYDHQFRRQQFSNERDWKSCLNRWCSCLTLRRCPLKILCTPQVMMSGFFVTFLNPSQQITGYHPSVGKHHFLLCLSISLQSFYFCHYTFQGTTSIVQYTICLRDMRCLSITSIFNYDVF
jgi:hypothetical protein